MLKNNLKIAIRILMKNKLFSLVNILSLSLSMAVGVILFTGIKATYDTDHFHPKLDQIVRILTQESIEGEETKWATAPLPLADLLESAFIVEKTVKVRLAGKYNLQTDKGDVPINIKFSEPSFFDVFGFKLLSGNAQSLTNDPTVVFLSETTAIKIFGNTNAVGQTVQFENLGAYTVGGIIQDPPLETHLPIEAMLSINAAEILEKDGAISDISENWEEFKSSAIYAKVKSSYDLKELNTTLQNYDRTLEKSHLQFLAQPMEDITPGNKDIKNNLNAGSDWESIKTQLMIILALTLLSAFNYISLALARAFSRAQEIGIRKTVGAKRGEIIGQFLIESILVALFALLVTVPCVIILIQYIPDPDINVAFSLDLTFILGLLTYAVITGVVAGAFPSYLLSAFQPIQMLRKMKNIKLFHGVAVYKALIVVQFSVTIMLMIFFVIFADYERKSNAIISSTVSANVLTLDLKGEKYENLQNEINQLSQVENTLATNWYYEANKIGKYSVAFNDRNLEIYYVSIDPKSIETEGVRLKSGQNFPQNMPQSAEQYVLVNEAAALMLHSKSETLVGQSLLLDFAYVQVLGIMPNEIIGETKPLIYRYLPNEIATLTIKIKPDTERVATQAIQALWMNHFPEKTANIQNVKENYALSTGERMYMFGGLALMVMIIAGLGILGIASYSVETQTKELGIRKVLGASNTKLVWTITKSFGILILVAGLIGVPAGFFGGDLLKQESGYDVDLGLINISIGFASVAIIALLTVLSQTIRAGQIEPVKVLKAE